jgi:hypothetical protein
MRSIGLAALVVVFAACGGGSSGTSGGTTGGGTTGGSTTGGSTTGGTTGGSCPTGETACAGNCCTGSQTCVSNACCDNTQVCGTNCCSANAACVQDNAGNKSCATKCTDSTQCGGTTPCCTPLANTCLGATSCPSVCAANASGRACRCATGSECSNNCCAPLTDTSGNPVGPLVCKPFDGAAYDCCSGLGGVTCSGNGCCAGDSAGNHYCAQSCLNPSQCGNANCVTFQDTSLTSCSGTTFCGP